MCVLPRIAHDKLRSTNFQFDRARAVIHLPDFFQAAAHSARRDEAAKKKGKAKEKGSGEEQDEAQRKEQLPRIIDWPGPEEPFPPGEEQNGEE